MMEFRDHRWKVQPAIPGVALSELAPAFLPDWNPADSGTGRALIEIAERYFHILGDKVGQSPDKAKLAFLELLGVRPIPAHPARCPVVFELPPGNGHARAPERTQLAAQPVDAEEQVIFETESAMTLPTGRAKRVNEAMQVIFETESAMTLADSRLVEVKVVMPNDRFADHTADVIGERTFSLFQGRQAIPRELYLAHDRAFAISPGSVIELQVEVTQGSLAPNDTSPIRWEYWDGGGWTPFALFSPITANSTTAYSEDGTDHLTRSGPIRLRTSGKPAEKTIVRGVNSYWIRGQIQPTEHRARKRPTVAVSSTPPPKIDRVRVLNQSGVTGFAVAKVEEKLLFLQPHHICFG